MSDAVATKDVEVTVAVDAPPEVVWEAITSAEQLQSWFPLRAEVAPGVGGKVGVAWGEDDLIHGTIEIWEPGRHLRYAEVWPGATVKVAVDYTLEARDGGTVVRMVNSGFSADDDWSDFLDTLDSGWRYFLWNLKHYVEHHAGTRRRMVWDRRKVALPKDEAWALITGPDGLVPVAGAGEGDTATLWSGDRGTVRIANAPIHLGCRFPELQEALLLVELEPGDVPYSLGVWLSLYGVEEERAVALERSLDETLGRLFGQARENTA